MGRKIIYAELLKCSRLSTGNYISLLNGIIELKIL